MRIAVWIVSVLLALTFLYSGGVKVAMSAAELAALSQGVPVVVLKIAGFAEVLGALGVVLPAATRILPVLTPVAAAGLVVVTVGATITNIIFGLYAHAALAVLLGVLSGFVAWARFGPAAVAPRGTRITVSAAAG